MFTALMAAVVERSETQLRADQVVSLAQVSGVHQDDRVGWRAR